MMYGWARSLALGAGSLAGAEAEEWSVSLNICVCVYKYSEINLYTHFLPSVVTDLFRTHAMGGCVHIEDG